MTNKKKKNTKVVEKTKEEKVATKLSDETKTFIKTTVIVALCLAVSYALIMLLGKAGMFEKGYEKPEKEEEVIVYNKAIIGTVFNRPEAEYYVAFDDFSGETSDAYFTYLLNSTDTETQIYKLDMSLGINSKYAKDQSNPNAQTSKDLKINGPTLIKIKNGKNVLYLENIEEISKELKK